MVSTFSRTTSLSICRLSRSDGAIGRGSRLGRELQPTARRARGGASRRRTHLRPLGPLEVEVQVVLPGEADAPVDLDPVARHLPVGVGDERLGHRGGQRRVGGVLIGGPRGVVGDRLRVLDGHQHVRAPVLDRLVGADRPPEGDAHLRVLGAEVEDLLRAPAHLGAERDRRPGPGPGPRPATPRWSGPEQRVGPDLDPGRASPRRASASGPSSAGGSWRRPSGPAGTRKRLTPCAGSSFVGFAVRAATTRRSAVCPSGTNSLRARTGRSCRPSRGLAATSTPAGVPAGALLEEGERRRGPRRRRSAGARPPSGPRSPPGGSSSPPRSTVEKNGPGMTARPISSRTTVRSTSPRPTPPCASG